MEMVKEFEFKVYEGDEVLAGVDGVKSKIQNIIDQYDFMEGHWNWEFVSLSDDICCMFDGEDLKCFAWLAYAYGRKEAEICWFIADKSKTKALESKWLLDKILQYCKENKTLSVKCSCFPLSWGKIKDVEKLLKRYGYKLSKDNDSFYDISFDIS